MTPYPAKFRKTNTMLIITKPSGEMVRRDVELRWDTSINSVSVKFKGESALQGYIFDLLIPEVNRVVAEGEWSHE